MKKYTPFITLGLLVLVLVYLLVVNKNKLFPSNVSKDVSSLDQKTSNQFQLPIVVDNHNVTSVLIHYFLTGKLKELQKTNDGTRIVYEEDDSSLPPLIVTSKTRVLKITPPYEVNSIPVNVNTFKPGQTIDISAEYDIRTGTWYVLDVFYATDRN